MVLQNQSSRENVALDGTEVPFDFTSVFATLSDAKLEI